MTGWRELDEELEAWSRAGKIATFWWRDDDATAPTAALDRLLEQTARAAGRPVPVSLAVIPVHATSALAERLAECPHAAVLQHGYAHANHAPPAAKKIELGLPRSADDVLDELQEGRRQLFDLFRGRALPTLVPPWNRIDLAVVRRLPSIGFAALSTHGPRRDATVAPGIKQVNTHVDILDWRGTGGFVGMAAALKLAVRHLAQRRRGQVDVEEPTGLLTHHLVHDDAAWRFLAMFLARIDRHPAARWLAGDDVFRNSPSSAHAPPPP